jgi:DNA invertase Pin-like site-specific DNA recombinase
VSKKDLAYCLSRGVEGIITTGKIENSSGRKVGSTKSREQKEQEYAKVIKLLRKGESMRNVAKLCDVSLSSVQRVKKEFFLQ